MKHIQKILKHPHTTMALSTVVFKKLIRSAFIAFPDFKNRSIYQLFFAHDTLLWKWLEKGKACCLHITLKAILLVLLELLMDKPIKLDISCHMRNEMDYKNIDARLD